MEILTARPKNMPFEAYKEHFKKQKQWLKNRKQNPLVYYVSWKNHYDSKGQVIGVSRSLPFVGSVRYDLTEPV